LALGDRERLLNDGRIQQSLGTKLDGGTIYNRAEHDLQSCRGVLDSSIIQGPVSVAPCQTLVSRFATFASQGPRTCMGAARCSGAWLGAWGPGMSGFAATGLNSKATSSCLRFNKINSQLCFQFQFQQKETNPYPRRRTPVRTAARGGQGTQGCQILPLPITCDRF
jgi:hypothetical protein